jgi:hypothetical protein
MILFLSKNGFLRGICAALFVLFSPFIQAQESSCILFKMPVTAVQNVGDTVDFPVKVSHFNDVISMQMAIRYDTAQFTYAGVNLGANPLSLDGSSYAHLGQHLILLWIDLNGVTLPDSTELFRLRLKAKSAMGASVVQFVPPPIPGSQSIEVVQSNTLSASPCAFLDGHVSFGTTLPAPLPDVNSTCVSKLDCGGLFDVNVESTNSTTFSWTGPGQFSSNLEDLNDISPAQSGSDNRYILTLNNGNTRRLTLVLPTINIPFFSNLDVLSLCGPELCLRAQVIGGDPPLQFMWSNGSTNDTLCTTIAGQYSYSVTDDRGCTLFSDTVTWAPSPPIVITPIITHYNCRTGQLGSFVPVGPPGSAYVYVFSTPPAPNDPWYPASLLPGEYSVIITDATNGCTSMQFYTIVDEGSLQGQMELAAADCTTDDTGTLLLLRTTLPSTIEFPATLHWSNGTVQEISANSDTLAISGALPDGVYQLQIVDSAGCSATYQTLLDCPPFLPPASNDALLVWPGDADNNNAVNHHDLLYVGLGLGTTGEPRPNASLDWAGQPLSDWAQMTLTNLPVNFKHLDTNGDGVISLADTTAIQQNWGKVIDPDLDNPFAVPDPTVQIGTAVPLAFENSVISEGQIVGLPLILGSAEVPATDLRGLSLSISYDANYIQPLYFEPLNSWLGNPDDNLVMMSKIYQPQGRMDIALTRTDGFPGSGWGIIGRWFIIIEDEIFLKNGTALEESGTGLDSVVSKLFFSNIFSTGGSNGTGINVSAPPSRVTLVGEPSSVQEQIFYTSIHISPNPAHDFIQIFCEKPVLQSVILHNAQGQFCQRVELTGRTHPKISTQNYPAGVYFATIITEHGTVTKTFTVR